MSTKQSFSGVNSSSSCLHQPSGLHISLPSANQLHTLPLFGEYSSSGCHSFSLERLTGSLELNSTILRQEFFEDPTQVSNELEDTQSLPLVGFSREQNPRGEQQTPSHSNPDYSFPCYLDSENKNYLRPTDTKRRNINYVPEELKNDRYWDRRKKNNLAAKK